MAHFGGVLLCQFCRELVECLLVRRSKVGQHGRRLEERETESECVCVCACGGGSRSATWCGWWLEDCPEPPPARPDLAEYSFM